MTYNDMEDVKRANEEAGFHFFSEEAMRFFKSRVSWTLYHGRYFITSEKGPNKIRAYTIREARPDGGINDIGDFQAYATRAAAIKAVEDLQ